MRYPRFRQLKERIVWVDSEEFPIKCLDSFNLFKRSVLMGRMVELEMGYDDLFCKETLYGLGLPNNPEVINYFGPIPPSCSSKRMVVELSSNALITSVNGEKSNYGNSTSSIIEDRGDRLVTSHGANSVCRSSIRFLSFLLERLVFDDLSQNVGIRYSDDSNGWTEEESTVDILFSRLEVLKKQYTMFNLLTTVISCKGEIRIGPIEGDENTNTFHAIINKMRKSFSVKCIIVKRLEIGLVEPDLVKQSFRRQLYDEIPRPGSLDE
ncbi:hypothetical protein Tco_0778173 [Tanacetum coccineum]